MKYRRGYKYQLDKDETFKINLKPEQYIKTKWIELTTLGILTIREGYAWDGASNALDTYCFMRGSAAHDALYQLISLGWLKPSDRIEADKVLIEICKKDGMSAWRAWYVYAAVRFFGGRHLIEDKVYEVGNEID